MSKIINMGFMILLLGSCNNGSSISDGQYNQLAKVNTPTKDEIIDFELLTTLQINNLTDVCLTDRWLYILADDHIIKLNVDNKNSLPDTLPLNYSLKQVHKVSQLMVRNNILYLGSYNSIDAIDLSTGSLLKSVHCNYNIDFFHISQDSNIYIVSANNLKKIDWSGEILNDSESSVLLNGNMINTDTSFVLNSYNKLYIFNHKYLPEYEIKTIDSLSLFFKDPYLACLYPGGSVWYSYSNRDKLVILDRSFNRIKTLELGDYFKVSKQDLIEEEGYPNLKIFMDGKTGYFILKKEGVKIFKGRIL